MKQRWQFDRWARMWIPAALLGMLLTSPLVSQQLEMRMEGPFPARAGETCLVCNSPTTEADIAYIVDGQRFAIKKEMEAEFLANPRQYIAAYRPEGMLFSAKAPVGPDWTVLLLGTYVLAGVVFGALCAQLAMRRNRPASKWFFYGLLANVLAWAALKAQPPEETVSLPSGLQKVSRTGKPSACPGCGHQNHPLAKRCLHCGNEFTPPESSEASRERKRISNYD